MRTKTEGFDAVAWMRKRREEIDREDAGLSCEERRTKTRSLLRQDPLWRHLKGRVVETRSLREHAGGGEAR
jgi:hypothetical protein